MRTLFNMLLNIRKYSQGVLIIVLLGSFSESWAFNWQDLWTTKNRQAQALMDAGQFSKAQDVFDDPAWQATATYRAGDYKQAADQFRALNNADGYYNQGNALAHNGQLESAINAYDNALAISPDHQDALHNKKIVSDLIKKQSKQKQDKKQGKQKQDKQEQNKQEQDKQEQDKQKQDKQEQDKQEQNKQQQDKQEQDKQEQDKQEQNKQQQDKQEREKNKKPIKKSTPSRTEKEQAKKQWLHLVPDDPGGLMREKFMRDYWARHPNQGY